MIHYAMGLNTHPLNLCTGALALAGLVAMQAAIAAPPQTQRLDLRAPAHLSETATNASDRGFPARRASLGLQEVTPMAALGATGARVRPTIQEFVRRVHQEGLPVARLFEGKSALVHLGLSPKGKPGLWLVQKIR